MRILVTNDDGIASMGLHRLVAALADLGDVTVVAPDSEYSGASAALGALDRLRPGAERTEVDGASAAWAVSGPPALCVTFARLGAFGPPFDLVVAGINPGANVGRAVYHSGTVGAAVTARLGGVTGIAISQAVRGFGIEGQAVDEMLEGQLWDTAGSVARDVVAAVIAEPPSEPVVVNLNVPNLELADLEGWRLTGLGAVPTRSMRSANLSPETGKIDRFRVRLDWGDPVSLPADTDGGAVEAGYVSLTLLDTLHEADPDGAPSVARALERMFA